MLTYFILQEDFIKTYDPNEGSNSEKKPINRYLGLLNDLKLSE